MSAPRTVTLQTVDRGPVTIPEPGWCRGHEGEPPVYRSDITHNSVTVKAAAHTDSRGRVQLLQAHISHAPYLELHTEPDPVVSVQLDCVEDFTAEDIPQLLEGLRSAERVLTFVAAEALRLRGEQS
ncbi:hypothetical protein OG819_22260 [Streptomyces sp. NBC_01549]|uniref:DUF6907 domain-containing protein n=1 Tax=Streptomyces sp. NBC_01549 TaxID=2975874 RepID=UPI002251D768|nr:hypothetical protein [Streptomyces sp. NBC_01549]MCX4592355.1 hypothetical protein [Streptomyces sp. NBC_01549]